MYHACTNTKAVIYNSSFKKNQKQQKKNTTQQQKQKCGEILVSKNFSYVVRHLTNNSLFASSPVALFSFIYHLTLFLTLIYFNLLLNSLFFLPLTMTDFLSEWCWTCLEFSKYFLSVNESQVSIVLNAMTYLKKVLLYSLRDL